MEIVANPQRTLHAVTTTND